MGINLLYDTNIFIYHLNGSEKYKQYFQRDFLEQNQVFLSNITRIELLSYPDITDSEENKIKLLLKEFEIIPLISPIEEMCIKIRKEKKIKLPDAIIIATAKYIKSDLISEDKELVKVFKEIK